MDELVFIARSETSGDLGCIWIAKDEIVALMAADDSMVIFDALLCRQMLIRIFCPRYEP